MEIVCERASLSQTIFCGEMASGATLYHIKNEEKMDDDHQQILDNNVKAIYNDSESSGMT